MQTVLQPASPPLNDDTPRSSYSFTSHHPTSGSGDADDEWAAPPEVELANTTRMLSATIGALLTSFVVTPFDVVKTRLQAQLHPINHSDTTHPPPAAAPHSHSHTATYPHHQPHQHYQPSAPPPASASLHSHPSASSASIRPLAVGVTPQPHLSSSQLLDRCSHVRLQTGFMDTWCNRCTITASHAPHLAPASFAYGFAPRVAAMTAAPAAVDLHFTGTLDAVSKLVRHEGMGSLWRGLSPQLLLSIPSTVVYFWAYDKLKMSLSSVTAHPTASPTTAQLTSYVSLLSPLIAGTSARAITTVMVSPIELIRTRTQSLSHNTSMWAIARDEVRKGGIRSLWRGANPTLWRDVPFSAFYWTSYEWIKVRLLRSGMHRVSAVRRRGGDVDVAYQRMLMWTSFVAGASSGMIAAVFTHPFDLVKTRRQIEMYNLSPTTDSTAHATSASSIPTQAAKGRQETFSVLRLIVVEEGWRGLFTGLLARMSKIAPACAIMISTYELSKAKFGQLHREGKERHGQPLLSGMRKEMS